RGRASRSQAPVAGGQAPGRDPDLRRTTPRLPSQMSSLTSPPPARRRRTDRERSLLVAAGGAAVLGVIALLIYVVVHIPNGAPFLGYKTLYADVPDPGNLQPHSDVRIAGVRVGQVIKVSSHRGRARVEFKLDPG